MIKRIIFDIDSTLLNTEIDCISSYNEFFEENKEFKINGRQLYDEIEGFYNLIDSYPKDKLAEDYKELFINYVKENIISEFNEDLFKKLYDKMKNYGTLINNNTKDILEYLNSKYDLVVLSNFFFEYQEKRLEKAGIKKYFKEIWCIDNFGVKPVEKTFTDACYPYELNECLIIGDSITSDIKTPVELGMNAIHLDINSSSKSNNYQKINSLDELKEIL